MTECPLDNLVGLARESHGGLFEVASKDNPLTSSYDTVLGSTFAIVSVKELEMFEGWVFAGFHERIKKFSLKGTKETKAKVDVV